MKSRQVLAAGMVLFLFLTVSVFAQSPPEPPQAPDTAGRTTSFEKLIDSTEDTSSKVKSLKDDIYKLRIQLDRKLDQQYNNLLIFLAVFHIGMFSFTKIVSRIYGWLTYKKKKREREKIEQKIMSNLSANHKLSLQLQKDLKRLHLRLLEAEKRIKPDNISPLPPPKSCSFLRRLFGRCK